MTQNFTEAHWKQFAEVAATKYVSYKSRVSIIPFRSADFLGKQLMLLHKVM